MKPLFNNLLIRAQKAQQKVGGIVVPGNNNTETGTAEVVALGEEVTRVSIGQHLYYAKSDAKKVNVNGEDLYILQEKFVLGVCL